MKKLFALMCAVLLLASATGCGNSSGQDSQANTDSEDGSTGQEWGEAENT